MFPEDWQLSKLDIEYQKQNLKNDFAGLDTQGLKRALFSTPEKLAAMIGMKLDHEEQLLFKGKEASRWFAEEFPQFRIGIKL